MDHADCLTWEHSITRHSAANAAGRCCGRPSKDLSRPVGNVKVTPTADDTTVVHSYCSRELCNENGCFSHCKSPPISSLAANARSCTTHICLFAIRRVRKLSFGLAVSGHLRWQWHLLWQGYGFMLELREWPSILL